MNKKNSKKFNKIKIAKAIIKSAPLEDFLPTYLDEYIHTNGRYDLASSPFSNDANHSHFRVDKKSNTWTDYSMVEDNYRGQDLIKFVQMEYNLDFKQAMVKIFKDFPQLQTKQLTQDDLKEFKNSYQRKNYDTTDFFIKKPMNTHMAYKSLSTIAFLNKEDREELKNNRHLTDKEIKDNNFFSMPDCTPLLRAKLRAFIATGKKKFVSKEDFIQHVQKYGRNTPELAMTMHNIFDGVPGFYTKDGEIYWNASRGLALPVFDTQNRIVGIQIRRRQVKKGETRYIWFSSSMQTGGNSAGSPINYVTNNFNAQTLIVTEGTFKAIQYAKNLKAQVLGLPGVGNFKNIKYYIDAINKHLGNNPINNICIGYDADALSNKMVFTNEKRLYDTIKKAYPNMKVTVVFWNQKLGKGFDDLVFNHPNDFRKELHYGDFETYATWAEKRFAKKEKSEEH